MNLFQQSRIAASRTLPWQIRQPARGEEATTNHPRRHEVDALLVELNPDNAAFAQQSAGAAGLAGVRVSVGDASRSGAYADIVPADICHYDHRLGCPQRTRPGALRGRPHSGRRGDLMAIVPVDSPELVADAVAVFTLAFRDDPVTRWLYPGASALLEGFPRLI